MSRSQRAFSAAALALLLAAPAGAQGQELAGPGSTIAILGGSAATSSTAGPMLGGTFVFDVNERWSIEGQGAWFGRGSGAEALGLAGSVLLNIVPLGNTVVPYAAVGGGMYRSWFDLGHTRLLGAIDPEFGPGSAFCPAAGTGLMGHGPGLGTCVADPAGSGVGYWGVGNMPQFYARRLGVLTVPAGGAWQTRTFTDPAVVVGGGARIHLARHLDLRPDARALVAFDGSRTHTVGVFGVNIGYRF